MSNYLQMKRMTNQSRWDRGRGVIPSTTWTGMSWEPSTLQRSGSPNFLMKRPTLLENCTSHPWRVCSGSPNSERSNPLSVKKKKRDDDTTTRNADIMDGQQLSIIVFVYFFKSFVIPFFCQTHFYVCTCIPYTDSMHTLHEFALILMARFVEK